MHEVWRAQRTCEPLIRIRQGRHLMEASAPCRLSWQISCKSVQRRETSRAYRRSTPRVRSSMTDHWDLRILAPVPLAVAVAISSPLVATPLIPVSSPLLGEPLVSALAPASTAGRQQWWRRAREDGLDMPGGVSQYEFVWTRKRFCGGTGWGKGNFFSRHELPSTIAFLTNRLHTKANQPCLRCRTSRIYDQFHQQPSRDWCLHVDPNDCDVRATTDVGNPGSLELF
jgi:hypothetical protein